MNNNSSTIQGCAVYETTPRTGEVFEEAAALSDGLSKCAALADMLVDRLEPILMPHPEANKVACGSSPLRSTKVGQELQTLTVRANSVGERLNMILNRLALP